MINIAEEYFQLKSILQEFNPDTIIHFAEQRSAPYSMKNETTRKSIRL